MTDREKVINDLQEAVNDDWMWQHADYYALTMERAIALLKEQEDLGTELTNAVELIHKKNERIKELLKEQEPVEPKVIRENEFGHPVYACGKCGCLITESMNYCLWCGRKVGEVL